MDERTTRVARTLHLLWGGGYCSLGTHQAHATYRCMDDARAILKVLDGAPAPDAFPERAVNATLSARREARARLEQAERKAQARMRKR